MNKRKKTFLIIDSVITALWIIFLFSGYSDKHESFWLTLIFLSVLVYGIVVYFVCRKKKDKNTVINQQMPIHKQIVVNQNPVQITPQFTQTQVDAPKQTSNPDFLKTNSGVFEKWYEYTEVPIVGRQHHSETIPILGEPVIIEHEKDNAYDDKAISVSVLREDVPKIIGYISKTSRLKDMAFDFINSGNTVKGFIDDDINSTMTVAYYKDEMKDYENYYSAKEPVKTFKLSKKGEMADLFEVGTEVNVDYDVEKDKDILQIDYLDFNAPKSLENDYLNTDKYIMFVIDIRSTETGASFKIGVFEK